MSGLDISLCTLLTTSVGSGPGVGISRSSGTSGWDLVLGPLVPDTLSDQCIFPGMGICQVQVPDTLRNLCIFPGLGTGTSGSLYLINRSEMEGSFLIWISLRGSITPIVA